MNQKEAIWSEYQNAIQDKLQLKKSSKRLGSLNNKFMA